MTEKLLTTREVAEMFQCHPKKVSRQASALGIGVNLGGRAGFRFSEADVEALRESMKVAAA